MSDLIVQMDSVGKMYKIFPSRTANLVNALGLRGRRPTYREFWAVRGFDLELHRRQRIGIIGRNGAGKSTILKLITQNIDATEGTVDVYGDVQALLETGGGLHPEFTGSENIRAALAFQGLGAKEIAEAEGEIAEFTELGRFLEQPFRTYSTGMQARLAFAIATTVQPEILIVDEVLGAGDAYFFTKSTARMRELIDSGAAVILVSHALDQIVRFCDHTIWLDRGRIVMRGSSTEVVKAYAKFIRELEDKRLQAKNRKALLHRYDAFERESYTDHLAIEVAPPHGGHCDVAEVRLLRDGSTEDSVRLGEPQDADPTESAFVQLDGSGWSDPVDESGFLYRTTGADESETDTSRHAPGWLVFHLWFFYPDSDYAVEIRYRTTEAGAIVRVSRGGKLQTTLTLPPTSEWRTEVVTLSRAEEAGGARTPAKRTRGPRVSRWPGEGSLLIESVELADADGEAQAVFEAGTPMRVTMTVVARRAGAYEVIPAATIYRLDGILATNLVGERFSVDVDEESRVELTLDLGTLNLGDGRYVFSLAIYRKLEHLDVSEAYDLLDRSYEFEVTGNAPFDNGVFRHPAAWTVSESDSLMGTVVAAPAQRRA